MVARGLADLIDDRFGHTFADSFRSRSPYQPGVGNPVPLDSPDLRRITATQSTSPPWRLANRLDETRRVRLADGWAVQFRVVFDYSIAESLDTLMTHDTVIATCNPNRSLRELDLTHVEDKRTFPIGPADAARQRGAVNQLIGQATGSGASIIVLPELCLTEEIALELQEWVRRPDGPDLLIAGSFHHEDRHQRSPGRARRRNTAIAWLRGHDQPLIHDKHSPGDRPILEDIQPEGWPELRVYVSTNGWHLVIAVCRDLLNPLAVNALAESGANLVLVPAMSETLMAFGGPVAHLVGAGQAFAAVANNPGDWTVDKDIPARRRPRVVRTSRSRSADSFRAARRPRTGGGPPACRLRAHHLGARRACSACIGASKGRRTAGGTSTTRLGDQPDDDVATRAFDPVRARAGHVETCGRARPDHRGAPKTAGSPDGTRQGPDRRPRPNCVPRRGRRVRRWRTGSDGAARGQ